MNRPGLAYPYRYALYALYALYAAYPYRYALYALYAAYPYRYALYALYAAYPYRYALYALYAAYPYRYALYALYAAYPYRYALYPGYAAYPYRYPLYPTAYPYRYPAYRYRYAYGYQYRWYACYHGYLLETPSYGFFELIYLFRSQLERYYCVLYFSLCSRGALRLCVFRHGILLCEWLCCVSCRLSLAEGPSSQGGHACFLVVELTLARSNVDGPSAHGDDDELLLLFR